MQLFLVEKKKVFSVFIYLLLEEHCHGLHMEVRGQLTQEVSPFLSPCDFSGLKLRLPG